ncbi:unnamed protein product [Sympodiomycopsis kandeliae]
MSSADVIDALFNRTVDIVQNLPKAGPIQTSYEEKLSLYSLYKQATEGNVNGKRPGMLDMLARAKWDHWNQRHGMSSIEAKQLYVESMMRTLRKFGDRREARDLIQELENFSGRVAERVMRGALADDDTETETETEGEEQDPRYRRDTAEEEEDDHEQQDRLASLRASSSGRVDRHPLPPRGGVSRQSSLPTSASRPPMTGPFSDHGGGSSAATPLDSDSSDDDDNDDHRRPPPSGRGGYQPRPGTSQAGYAGGRAGPSYGPGPAHYYSGGPRAPPSVQGSQSAFGGRYPAPPRSESNMGGGAGASLYSAIGPSSTKRTGPGPGSSVAGRPPVEQHHYYHRPSEAGATTGAGRAPSSVGGGAPSRAGGTGPSGGNRPEVDQALQSIQASLAALHERLNRVESSSSSTNRTSSNRGSSLLFSGAYQAVWNAFHDLSNLLGITSGTSVNGQTHATPSFGESNQNTGSRPSRVRLGLSILAALLNLSLRLTLDLTSLGILVTVVLFLVKRISGRGDPLLLLRLLRRFVGSRSARMRAVENKVLGN